MSKGEHIPLRGYVGVEELQATEDRVYLPLLTGIRVRAEIYDGDIRLTARNNRDMTYVDTAEDPARQDPELRFSTIVDELQLAFRGVDAVADCQLVAIDGGGYPNYERFRSPSARVYAYVTDVMEHDGDDFTRRPFGARYWILRDSFDDCKHVMRAPLYDVTDLESVIETAGQFGYTQIISKTMLSHYVDDGPPGSEWQVQNIPVEPRQQPLV